MISTRYEWIMYVLIAGLAWGTYVPLIFYGGAELIPAGRPPTGGRLMAILCVGIAYFVIAVLFPLGMFLTRQAEWPDLKTTGLVFSSLAGVAGAVGALCVIFASRAAVVAARDAQLDPDTFRIFIAPLIFGTAPVINTLVSTIWHPRPGQPFHFELVIPDWKLLVGIVLVGAGAFLVLLSKEQAEVKEKHSTRKPAPAAVAHTTDGQQPRVS